MICHLEDLPKVLNAAVLWPRARADEAAEAGAEGLDAVNNGSMHSDKVKATPGGAAAVTVEPSTANTTPFRKRSVVRLKATGSCDRRHTPHTMKQRRGLVSVDMPVMVAITMQRVGR